MRERIHTRLAALRQELEAGQAELQLIERRQAYLRETLLRIGGAIQVLEELLVDSDAVGRDGAAPGEASPAASRGSDN
jgi:hypothetical protein